MMNPLLGGLLGSLAGNYLMNKDNENGTVWDKLGLSGANAQTSEQMPVSTTSTLGQQQIPQMMTQFQDPLDNQQLTQQKIMNMPLDARTALAQNPMPQGGVASQFQNRIEQTPPPPEEEPGFMSQMGDSISDFWNDEEKMARLTIGLNSMRLNPDANLAKSMQNKIDKIQKNKGSTKTAQALRAMGREDLAKMVESGQIDAKTAVSLAYEKKSALQEKMDLYNKDPELFAKMVEEGVIGSSGTTVNVGGQQMTPGWKKIDEAFADEYITWVGGTGADTAGNIAKLEDVLAKLESGEKLTGPIMGQLPDFLMAFLDPDAVGSREAVEGVVQRNLKAVLGAQFTEKEGEKLIKRAYNPTLGGAENARRLRVLTKQMNSALQSKNEMAQYFRDNGTLMGYKGRVPHVNDFWAALEGLTIGQQVGNKTYIGGDPKLESSYKDKE